MKGYCMDCRYWSDMIARSGKSGIEALCLSAASPNMQRYMTGRNGCDAWKSGPPVDDMSTCVKCGQDDRMVFLRADGPICRRCEGKRRKADVRRKIGEPS